MHRLHTAVATLMRTVGEQVVMRHYGKLRAGDITEKSPGEIVTIADREAEARLTDGLRGLVAGAVMVGEEACAADPALLRRVDDDTVWLIDPIDGTANYAAGNAPFGIMVALVEGGETQAGWLYDPVSRRLCHASRGAGAFIDDRRVRVRGSGSSHPVAALATQFMRAPDAAALRARTAMTCDLVPIPRCAAEHYPRICTGGNDIALFQRTLPWDHAPGVLFLKEAGGRAARFDGSPYRPGDVSGGLLVAGSAAMWDFAAEAIGCSDLDIGVLHPPRAG